MAANTMLRPVREKGVRSGFGNLFRKELGLWFGTSRWWKQAILWTLILNGIIVLIMVAMRSGQEAVSDPPLVISAQVFFKMAALATVVGGVLAIQDSIIGERQSGTAAWILSKPVARPAFVLTKFLAHAVGMTVLALVLQTAIWTGQTLYWAGELPGVVPMLTGLGLLAVHLWMYQALCLMLSTFFQGRGAVTGTALGILFGGQAVPGMLPWTLKVTPWAIPEMSPLAVLKMPLPDWFGLPVAITILLIPVFLGVAVWRFQREEL